jgi:hypothetical protein
VDGICAQLDMWRTSKFYKNKRFADAIHTWAGGNNVPSYISFVKQHVPGMTEDTIMDDAFWRSPLGLGFLKAQAWHEAGQPCPVSDQEWAEAQRRVFAPTMGKGTKIGTVIATGAATAAGSAEQAAKSGMPGWENRSDRRGHRPPRSALWFGLFIRHTKGRNMDWRDIGNMVAPMAPTLGGILGDLLPIPGGGVMGTMAGKMIATALGVPNDPDSIGAAIGNDPNALSKIQSAESEAAAKWPALAEIAKARFEGNTAQSQAINATMQAELAKGQPWWAWRNLYGYSVSVEATATSWVILYSLALNPSIFTNVSQSLSFFISWYGMRFGLLGYLHNGASNEKIAAVTGEAPSIIKSIGKVLKGK